MLKVLINAYACSPNMGSEPGMAWNWCVNLANYCEPHIITEGEFRDKIEAVLPTLAQGKNMHFYYNPVSDEVRKMCWNQGDWRFYKHYKIWQRKTLEIAKKIIQTTQIDIVHQLNMIGFREPGYLWQIEDIPFVWGPIGGLKQFPTAYLKGAGLKQNFFNRLKNFVNVLQLKYDGRVKHALTNADLLISSIPDSYRAIKKYHGLESVIIPETGCDLPSPKPAAKHDSSTLNIIWVGKFDFRKKLDIALKTIAKANNSNLHLRVYGTGSDKQISTYKALCHSLGIDEQAEWMGNRPNEEVKKAMRDSDVFLFTSVSEDTSTVVLEAVSQQLPVVCFDTCGMSAVINDKVGIKIPFTSPSQSVGDFAKALNNLDKGRYQLKHLSENCLARAQELSWDAKAKMMVDLYNDILDKK